MAPFAGARQLLVDAHEARAFPAATIEAGTSHAVRWQESFGRLTYDISAPVCRPQTIFDLASLTKVIATTSLAMKLVGNGRLGLDDRVATRLASWRGADRAGVTIRQLLDHSSGLPAHVRLFERMRGRAAYEAAIAELPLERAPGIQSVYSDVGFMLLGFLLEDAGGAPLDAQFAPLADMLGDWIGYRIPTSRAADVAPTENDPWRGHVLRGEVHDENAAALGGVAAHAGLFGTASAVGTFARLVLATFRQETQLGSPELIRLFASRTGVPDSTRALGWDTMKITSSCGTRMSPSAIGHTGFTGTSLWIDPEKDVYVALLTNRVHPTRESAALVELRPRVHDAVMADIANPSA